MNGNEHYSQVRENCVHHLYPVNFVGGCESIAPKLIEESEERRRRIIYMMSRLIDRKMKHFQDVNMFFLQTQNLRNELNA
ncbi:hypothetical protein H5410_051065 [Solanum commersonii]|uniref:Uncharacterized protein n=1 Tax=Solanum commersonii TaxID=4109 RepID=A0A9J5WZL9_SOLCO|nr:hypothetical protein H5410_051065 [Solanum commersonii]